jgi:hypothetical protein
VTLFCDWWRHRRELGRTFAARYAAGRARLAGVDVWAAVLEVLG